ncbi:MAG: TonB family protein [Pseudomonadota bacterium]
MTITMTPQTKAFGLSFALHTLMALLAMLALTRMYHPVNLDVIPMKHVTLVTLSHVTPMPIQPTITPPTTTITQPAPTQPITKPIVPTKTQPIVTQTIPVPSIPAVVHQAIPTETKPVVVAETKAIPVQAVIPSKPKIDTTSEKKLFYASLRTKIQQNLRYPFAARRVGKEGEVGVRFTLSDDGSIRNISVQRGEEIFHNAAKAAVASTAGIDIPKNLIDSLPVEMDLTLEFKLN